MSNPILIKAFDAQGAIPAYSNVKLGTADGTVVVATAASDPIIGVSGELPVAAGERVDVMLCGISYVVCGAAITRGTPCTSDASGRAVAAAAGNRLGVILLESATAAGDIKRGLLAQGVQ